MFKRVSFAMVVIALMCGAAACRAAVVNPHNTKQLPAMVGRPSPAVLQRLRTPVPRQTLLNALLANPATRSSVQDAIGGAKPRVGALSAGAVSALHTSPGAPLPGDADFKNLNWKNGFTFTLDSIPTYGSGNWKLGVFDIRQTTLETWYPNVAMIRTQFQPWLDDIVNLYVELPMETALYMVTVKIVRSDGQCYGSWVTQKDSYGRSAVYAWLWQLKESPDAFTGTPLPLTPLPDGTGFVGLVTAGPEHSNDTWAATVGMRRMEANIAISFYPKAANPNELPQDLLFGGITITRI